MDVLLEGLALYGLQYAFVIILIAVIALTDKRKKGMNKEKQLPRCASLKS